MILILSDSDDFTTSMITEWLLYWDLPFIRLHGTDILTIKRLSLSSENQYEVILKTTDNREVNFSKIKVFWYRRGQLSFNYSSTDLAGLPQFFLSQMKNQLKHEIEIISEFLYYLLESIPRIGAFTKVDVNKLKVLHLASLKGLQIPNTFITNKKNEVQGWRYNETPAITKSIWEGFSPEVDSNRYYTYTEKINLNDLPSEFGLSLFQSQIKKEADIRIFYLAGQCYSMAIRSQDSIQTSVDFRKYDNQKPNRNFPFNLPLEIETKLTALMKELNLETGSIDMVLTQEGELVFLEVNPVGQFHMTSIPCNYYLEHKLANHLRKLSPNNEYKL